MYFCVIKLRRRMSLSGHHNRHTHNVDYMEFVDADGDGDGDVCRV